MLLDRNAVSSTGTPVDTTRSPPSIQQVAEALRNGACPDDQAFDRFLPEELRLISGQYWTPLVVAQRAAQWLEEFQIRTVVDIGSGPGKFCVAAALKGDCHFLGLEHRPGLVAAARQLAHVFQVDHRVRFQDGAFEPHSAPVADAYYLYNPFGENLFGGDEHLEDVELTRERFSRDVAAVGELLSRADDGTFLVTYNGFGAKPPPCYREVRVDRELPNVLRMWRKVASA